MSYHWILNRIFRGNKNLINLKKIFAENFLIHDYYFDEKKSEIGEMILF